MKVYGELIQGSDKGNPSWVNRVDCVVGSLGGLVVFCEAIKTGTADSLSQVRKLAEKKG